ncbi:hypothetical protein NKR19_g4782 [Coniochaeta hoffmannii]|uniref:Uncharacterized protein n=1 Tax=Coniochaeta hoffmannii TaxID=91930 RepID=A0AA38RKY9_9PEZI|nr:hypothetical protein NKR19_g4782 [Coniochaeta hoffmannii]
MRYYSKTTDRNVYDYYKRRTMIRTVALSHSPDVDHFMEATYNHILWEGNDIPHNRIWTYGDIFTEQPVPWCMLLEQWAHSKAEEEVIVAGDTDKVRAKHADPDDFDPLLNIHHDRDRDPGLRTSWECYGVLMKHKVLSSGPHSPELPSMRSVGYVFWDAYKSSCNRVHSLEALLSSGDDISDGDGLSLDDGLTEDDGLLDDDEVSKMMKFLPDAQSLDEPDW